ncbi:MAG: hypothetical protein C0432_03860 [Candidatus Puniceispirillum sp.]|nr:hypothetical protein [Candidatus Pelagibacter sp.]MBA4283411.1 hypothetical protein [Candidatus Puniceispirillum sp.]
MMHESFFLFLGTFFVIVFFGFIYYLRSPAAKKLFSRMKIKGAISLKDQLYIDHKRKICVVESETKEYIIFCGEKCDFLVDSCDKQNPSIVERIST